MKKRYLTILLFLIMPFFSFSQDGKLEEAKQSLNTTKTSSSGGTTTKSTKTSSKKEKNSDSFSLGAEIGRLFLKFFLFVTYEVMIESEFEYEGRMRSAEISAYPYKNANYGNFIYTDSTNYSIARLDVSNNFVVENKNLYGNHLNLNFRFFKRMSVEASYLQLYEKLGNRRESFSLFSAMLNYHRVRTQKLDLWFGVGAMYVGKDVEKMGFSYGFGTEWFVTKPVSLLFSYNASKINTRNVIKSKIQMKYYINKYHISSGYEHYTLGVSKINTFSVGVGVSF